MRLSRLKTWEERAQDDVEEQRDALNLQMLETHDQLEKFDSWEGIKELLEEEQARAFTDVMNGEGENMILARERAKFISKLLRKRDDLEKQLDNLRSERNALEG